MNIINFDPESRATKLSQEGVEYHHAGNLDAARVHYTAALLLEPDHPLALQNLSGLMLSTGRNWAALSLARRVMVAAPQNPFALSNHAASLSHLGQYPAARREFEEVLKAVPDDPGILHNQALTSYMSGYIPAAIKAIKRSLELQPDVPDRLCDLGIFTLASGDIVGGLEIYEARWNKLYKSAAWKLGVPEWKGEPLNGKKLLIHHEQGFGDGIMLCRFVKNIMELGAQVTVAVPPELISLFRYNLDVSVVNWEATNLGDCAFDFHSPMLSLMRWLEISREKISPKPYLNVEPRAESLGPSGFRVGICWASGDHSPLTATRRRIVPLHYFFPFMDIPGVRLVSLQKGPARNEIVDLGAESFIFDPMGRVGDFLDTAQIAASLDMVVSVDSAVAHLAGALGRPTIVLGPYTRCWRWWSETNGLPWYRRFQIFAQERFGDWTSAVKRAKSAVEIRVQEQGRRHVEAA